MLFVEAIDAGVVVQSTQGGQSYGFVARLDVVHECLNVSVLCPFDSPRDSAHVSGAALERSSLGITFMHRAEHNRSKRKFKRSPQVGAPSVSS